MREHEATGMTCRSEGILMTCLSGVLESRFGTFSLHDFKTA